MAKKQGLHINKEDLFNLINEYIGCTDWLCEDKVINPANNAHRIKIKKESMNFCIDVFYRSDNTITVKEYSADGSGEESKQLVEYIKENIPFNNVPHGEFSSFISIEQMDLLIEYLSSIPGVSLADKSDNGSNGIIYKFTSDIGDNITLTYYTTTCRMRFQGIFLKLSAEIKCFLSPISSIHDQKGTLAICGHKMIIDSVIAKNLPKSHPNLKDLQQDLIHDSVSQLICKPITKDYSVWAFSILKGLEARIKEIFQHNSVTIYDKQGFSIYDSVNRKNIPLFKKNLGKFELDTSIISITHGDTINVLGECYDYLNKNRNYLFHTKQIGASRVLNTPDEAETIIYDVMKLFEESYNKLGY
ncbi:MAG: type II toxin-antitoxin system RnlA family toxin [Clostridiales bacterium]|nr:type II toxin-antitoxin system RnlA family toxin [Clostridiales bacterium]